MNTTMLDPDVAEAVELLPPERQKAGLIHARVMKAYTVAITEQKPTLEEMQLICELLLHTITQCLRDIVHRRLGLLHASTLADAFMKLFKPRSNGTL
jgi:hypothetical protein